MKRSKAPKGFDSMRMGWDGSSSSPGSQKASMSDGMRGLRQKPLHDRLVAAGTEEKRREEKRASESHRIVAVVQR
jgi:hypothetical protein